MPAAAAACEVGLAIADQERLRGIDRPLRQQLADHAGFRLAQLGDKPIALDHSLGMVGAVFEAIDVRAVAPQLGAHPAVQVDDVLFAVQPARDTGLVGDDEHQVARVVQPAHRLARAGDPADLVGMVHVARVLVQHAVAIEEGGRALHDARHHALRPLEVLRRADVDERRLDDHALDQAVPAQGPAARRARASRGRRRCATGRPCASGRRRR